MGCNNAGFILLEIEATTKLVVATAPAMKRNRYEPI